MPAEFKMRHIARSLATWVPGLDRVMVCFKDTAPVVLQPGDTLTISYTVGDDLTLKLVEARAGQ